MVRDEAADAMEAYCVGLHNAEAVDEYALFLEKCKDLVRLLDGNRRIAMCCCQNYGRLMHLQLYENQATEIQQEWNSIVEILKQCNYDEDICKTAVSAANEYFHTLIQRKKDDAGCGINLTIGVLPICNGMIKLAGPPDVKIGTKKFSKKAKK